MAVDNAANDPRHVQLCELFDAMTPDAQDFFLRVFRKLAMSDSATGEQNPLHPAAAQEKAA